MLAAGFEVEVEETAISSWSGLETFSSVPLLLSLFPSLETPNVLMVSDGLAAPGPNTTSAEAAL